MQAPAQRYVGHRVARVEDPRLLTGHGQATSTTSPCPGCSTRTSCAARSRTRIIRGIDVDAARRHPGVVAVYTGADMRSAHPPVHGLAAAARPLPPDVLRARHRPGAARRRPGGAGHRRVAVRRRGRRAARGRRLRGARRRSPPSSTRSTPRARRSGPDPAATCCSATAATTATSTPRSRDADRVVRERFVQHRYSNQPMETRGCVAEVDPVVGTVRYHSATQNSHVMKWSLAALTGRRPVWQSLVRDRASARAHGGAAAEGQGDGGGQQGLAVRATPAKHAAIEEPIGEGLSAPASPGKAMAQTFLREPVRIAHLARMLLGLLARDPVTLPRVTAQDIGGAFGVKVLPTREDVAVLAAAVDLGRSVKWIEDRNEHLLVAGQAREETLDVEAALRRRRHAARPARAHDDGPGRVPGVPVQRRDVPDDDPHDDPGAVPAADALGFTTTLTASNKATYVAYRGPWAVETWVRERMLDIAARELGHRSRRDPAPQHHRPRRAARGRCSPGRRSTCACRRAPPSSARSRSPTSSTGPRQQEAARAEGRCLGPRVRHLHRGRARPARLPGVDHARRRRRAAGGRAGPLGARGRRHRVGVHAADAARPGPRDDAGPGRGRRARRADRAGARPLRRHAHHAVRALRHRRQPVGADGRRRGHVLGARACASRSSTSPPICSKRRATTSSSTTAPSTWRASRRSRCRSPTSPRARPDEALRSDFAVRRRRGRLGAGDARVLGRGRPRRPGACTSTATSRSRTAAS